MEQIHYDFLSLCVKADINSIIRAFKKIKKGADFYKVVDQSAIRAIKDGRQDVIEFLFKDAVHRAHLDYNSYLVTACQEGNCDIIKFLLSYYPDLAALEYRCLKEAAKKGHRKAFDLLAQYDPKCLELANVQDAFLELCGTGDVAQNAEQIQSMCEYLLTLGARCEHNECQAWRKAVDKGNIQLLRIMIEHGVEISNNAHYAFKSACVTASLELLSFLIEHKQDVCVNNNFAIKLAVPFYSFEFVQLLLDNGAPLDIAMSCQTSLDNKDKLQIYANKVSLERSVQLSERDRSSNNSNFKI